MLSLLFFPFFLCCWIFLVALSATQYISLFVRSFVRSFVTLLQIWALVLCLSVYWPHRCDNTHGKGAIVVKSKVLTKIVQTLKLFLLCYLVSSLSQSFQNLSFIHTFPFHIVCNVHCRIICCSVVIVTIVGDGAVGTKCDERTDERTNTHTDKLMYWVAVPPQSSHYLY